MQTVDASIGRRPFALRRERQYRAVMLVSSGKAAACYAGIDVTTSYAALTQDVWTAKLFVTTIKARGPVDKLE